MPLTDDLDASSLHLLYAAHTLIARNETTNSTSSTENPSRPPVYKVIGLSLAIASGLFIGCSFVLKKVGLLAANTKYNEEAGEGYGYLKNGYWWGGMSLMILGEVCNFVAYAFTDAILVTPLGALSVVVTTILSAIFLKERLSFVGKVGCFNCIIGSIVIVLNAPEQSAVADIQEMKSFVIAPGFLSYAGVIILGSIFIALWVGPRYGKKSMFVYLSVCSFIGGISVVCTQGLGAAVVAQANKGHQFNQWFLYVLLVIVVCTLVTEIIYLNKALNLFNAALVTPTYYVFFTSTTIITSAILFRGFHGTGVTIATVVMGFLVICSGVVLLQLSKSAKDVPDAAIFKGDLDQVRDIAEQEHPESEPKADAIRGTASIIRRLSTPRRAMEQMEAKRLFEEKQSEHLEPLKENEVAEWDGLRRRKTVIDAPGPGHLARRKTLHPPLGMTHFPDDDPSDQHDGSNHGFLENVRDRAHTMFSPRNRRDDSLNAEHGGPQSPVHPVAMTDIRFPKSGDGTSPALPYGPGSIEEAQEHIFGLPAAIRKPVPSPRSKPLPRSPAPSDAGLQVPNSSKRQFSFSNILRHSRQSTHSTDEHHERPGTAKSFAERKAAKTATEEERLGLVKGDSARPLMSDSSPDHKQQPQPTVETIFLPNTYSEDIPRSASPDALDRVVSEERVVSDEDFQKTKRPYHEPFSFSSNGPSPGTSISGQRRQPSPPGAHTHSSLAPPTYTRDFAQSSAQRPQMPNQPSRSQNNVQRITIGNSNQPQPAAARSVPSLDPPVQLAPSRQQQNNPPSRSVYDEITLNEPNTAAPSARRGRPPISTGLSQVSMTSESPNRSDNSASGSKDRFAEQSARERMERRERAQRRQSGGPGAGRESTDDFS